MHRRNLLKTVFATGAALALPVHFRALAQDATPVAGSDILNVRWDLQQIAFGNGDVLTADASGRYTLQLLPGGRALVKFDCNMGSGSYTIDGAALTMGPFVSTLMGCPDDSFATQFGTALENAASYVVTTDASDSLNISMKADGGVLTFTPSVFGVTWEWAEFEGSDGSKITAADPSRYTLTFLEDGGATVIADCNRGNAQVTLDGASIDMTVATTRMACPPDSQADDFLRVLEEAVSWVIRDGMLALALPADAGIAMFRAVPPVIDEMATPAADGM